MGLDEKGGLMDNETLALERLNKAIEGKASLSQIAIETGLSKFSLSLFHNGKYPANKNIAKKSSIICLRIALLSARFEISVDVCREQQVAPFSAASGFQVELWRACQFCRRKKMLSDDFEWMITKFLGFQNIDPTSFDYPQKVGDFCIDQAMKDTARNLEQLRKLQYKDSAGRCDENYTGTTALDVARVVAKFIPNPNRKGQNYDPEKKQLNLILPIWLTMFPSMPANY